MKIALQQILDFVRRNDPNGGSQFREDRIGWYLHNNFYKLVADASGCITAIALARPVSSIDMAKDHYAYDESGPICYVDLAISIDKQTRRKLTEASGIKRFVNCTKIAFQRYKNIGRIKEYNSKIIKERFK